LPSSARFISIASSAPARARSAFSFSARDPILDLFARCAGNRVRVHEELAKLGADFGYSTLTAWLKREGIGDTVKPPAGQYDFFSAGLRSSQAAPVS
jgi:hypothetical protein